MQCMCAYEGGFIYYGIGVALVTTNSNTVELVTTNATVMLSNNEKFC